MRSGKEKSPAGRPAGLFVGCTTGISFKPANDISDITTVIGDSDGRAYDCVMDQAQAKSEPEARGPEELNGRFSDHLSAVSDGFVFLEREMNQRPRRTMLEYRFKTDKRSMKNMIPPPAITRAPLHMNGEVSPSYGDGGGMIREARERREELAPMQPEQRRGRFLAKRDYLKMGAAWSSVGGAWMSILILLGSTVDGASRK